MELDALTQWVTPENAPFLHTLELDWTMWGPGENTDNWFRALRNIRQVSMHFLLALYWRSSELSVFR